MEFHDKAYDIQAQTKMRLFTFVLANRDHGFKQIGLHFLGQCRAGVADQQVDRSAIRIQFD